METKRIVVIGIDGGTFTILNPLIQNGIMPNLASLIKSGASGNLISTSPPITGPAWRTFATGCNPGMHGVIDFIRLDNETKKVHISTASQINLPTIWSLLNANGLRCGVMGVPMTFPAKKLDGVMLTGLMTPSKSSNYCYPPELGSYLGQNNFSWVFSEGEDANPKNIKSYINAVIEDMRTKVDTAIHLLTKESPEFTAFIFGGSDPLQHQFMNIIDEVNHPDHESVIRFYKALDEHLSRLLALGDENTIFMVVSDHGFGKLDGFIHMNNWLLEKKYLFLKTDILTRFKYQLHRIGFTQENIYTLVRKLGLDLRRQLNRGRVFSLARKFFLSFDNVDWEKTKAYSLGHIGQVYIEKEKLKPGEYDLIKEKLIKDLKELRHPETKESLIEDVYQRDEIYKGPFVDQTPDLVLHPREFRHIAFGESEFASNKIIGPALHQGHHRLEGIVILKGPGIKPNTDLPDQHIQDILPTILYGFDLPIPSYIDGKVIRDAFEGNYLNKHPEKTIELDPFTLNDSGSDDISPDEEKKVFQRLRDLGYTA